MAFFWVDSPFKWKGFLLHLVYEFVELIFLNNAVFDRESLANAISHFLDAAIIQIETNNPNLN